MGFDPALFVNQPVDEYAICSICQDVMDQPTMVCNQGHSFCLDCITAWQKVNRDCPDCRTQLYRNMPFNRALHGMIRGFQVSCPEKEDDNTRCVWQGSLGMYLDSHAKTECPFIKVSCIDCGWRVRRKNLPSHKKHYCPERLVNCAACQERVRFSRVGSHQRNSCPERLVICSMCQAQVVSKTLTAHKKHSCPERFVMCPYCSQQQRANALDRHVTVCANRKFFDFVLLTTMVLVSLLCLFRIFKSFGNDEDEGISANDVSPMAGEL